MVGGLRHAHQRAEPQAAALRRSIVPSRGASALMSTTPLRPHHVELHQVEQRGAAGEELAAPWRGAGGGGAGSRCTRRRHAVDSEGPHVRPSFICGFGLLDGGDDVRIGGAAAEIAAHVFADVGVAVGVAFLHAADRRHDLPGRAVAALEGVVVDEGLLHRMQRAVAAGETLDGRDRRGPRPARPASGRTARAGRRPARCRRRTGRGRSPSWCRSGRGARAAHRAG